MLEQFVAVMPGTLGPALLVMCMSVMLTVGETSRSAPDGVCGEASSEWWRRSCAPDCAHPR